jgi:hypothetical protein
LTQLRASHQAVLSRYPSTAAPAVNVKLMTRAFVQLLHYRPDSLDALFHAFESYVWCSCSVVNSL